MYFLYDSHCIFLHLEKRLNLQRWHPTSIITIIVIVITMCSGDSIVGIVESIKKLESVSRHTYKKRKTRRKENLHHFSHLTNGIHTYIRLCSNTTYRLQQRITFLTHNIQICSLFLAPDLKP